MRISSVSHANIDCCSALNFFILSSTLLSLNNSQMVIVSLPLDDSAIYTDLLSICMCCGYES